MRLNAELNYQTTSNFELHRLSGITELENYFIGMIKKVIQHQVAKNKTKYCYGYNCIRIKL